MNGEDRIRSVSMESDSAEASSGRRYNMILDTRLKVRILNRFGEPQCGVEYILIQNDEEIRRGITDEEGWLREAEVLAEEITIKLVNGCVLYIPEDQENIHFAEQREEESTEENNAEPDYSYFEEMPHAVKEEPDDWQSPDEIFESEPEELGDEDLETEEDI